MNAVSKLVVLLSLGMLVTAAASATTIEQAYIETCRKDTGVPVPTTVVSPVVGPDYTGARFELDFVVDETGRPSAITVKSAPDETVAAAVTEAVKQWRFKPATRNGAPVATKVVLPVRIVDAEDMTFAAN